ncbi:hypothetical protein LY78DRAFT_189133 [Colletotrichum sublineola]|nr:hypothetical protein LY78DRAFT_189133 [Colletotrichum sublineola]
MTRPRKAAAGQESSNGMFLEVIVLQGRSDASEPTGGPPKQQALAGGLEMLRLWPRSRERCLTLMADVTQSVCRSLPCPSFPSQSTVRSPPPGPGIWTNGCEFHMPRWCFAGDKSTAYVRAGLQFGIPIATWIHKAKVPRMEVPFSPEAGRLMPEKTCRGLPATRKAGHE